ncbi:hypothetical protein V6N13_083245 [Hibiscus sabdariffa]
MLLESGISVEGLFDNGGLCDELLVREWTLVDGKREMMGDLAKLGSGENGGMMSGRFWFGVGKGGGSSMGGVGEGEGLRDCCSNDRGPMGAGNGHHARWGAGVEMSSCGLNDMNGGQAAGVHLGREPWSWQRHAKRVCWCWQSAGKDRGSRVLLVCRQGTQGAGRGGCHGERDNYWDHGAAVGFRNSGF